MFLGLLGGLAEVFNNYGAKGRYTGNSVGLKSDPNVDQTYKGKIQGKSKLPQKASHAEVEELQKQAKEAQENAKNLKEYRQALELLVKSWKDSYGETAKYTVFYQKILAEIAKIDAVANEGIGGALHQGNMARATLAGYEAACQGGASFRPFG